MENTDSNKVPSGDHKPSPGRSEQERFGELRTPHETEQIFGREILCGIQNEPSGQFASLLVFLLYVVFLLLRATHTFFITARALRPKIANPLPLSLALPMSEECLLYLDFCSKQQQSGSQDLQGLHF